MREIIEKLRVKFEENMVCRRGESEQAKKELIESKL